MQNTYMKKIFIGALVFITYLLADIPEWAISGASYKYPSSQYFLGIGIAEDRSQAVERARSDLIKQIKVKIESELTTEQIEHSRDDMTESSETVISRTKSSVDATVAGVEIAEVEKDGRQFYVLAILNKSKYFAAIRSQIDRIINKSNGLLDSARKNSKQGMILNALENYRQAAEIVTEYEPKNNLLVSLSGTSYRDAQISSGEQIGSEMRNIISKINIKLIEGNNQTGTSGELLPAAITIRTLYSENNSAIGVTNFPLIARYKDGDIIEKKRTDQDGFTSFKIKAVPTGMSTNSGTVEFQMAPEVLPLRVRDALSRAKCIVNYSIVIPDLEFSLKSIYNPKYSTLKQQAENIITASGFKVSENASLVINLDHKVRNEREIRSPFGTQYLIEIDAEFSLLNRSTDQKIGSYVLSSKGLSKESKDNAEEIALTRIKINKEDFISFLKRGSNN